MFLYGILFNFYFNICLFVCFSFFSFLIFFAREHGLCKEQAKERVSVFYSSTIYFMLITYMIVYLAILSARKIVSWNFKVKKMQWNILSIFQNLWLKGYIVLLPLIKKRRSILIIFQWFQVFPASKEEQEQGYHKHDWKSNWDRNNVGGKQSNRCSQ